MEVEGVAFLPSVTPLGSSTSLFLAGAGVRGLDINGNFITFTAIAIYLDNSATPSLAAKWKGKTADELAASADFFRDIFSGPFEKLTRVIMLKPLTGQQFSEKVTDNCVAQLKAAGTYTEAEQAAVEMFLEVFKPEILPPGACILFTHKFSSLTITLTKEGKETDAEGSTVIHNKALSEAILESIIGEHGVSPAAKRSLAERISRLLEEPIKAEEDKMVDAIALDV